jgi:hypothetical protein
MYPCRQMNDDINIGQYSGPGGIRTNGVDHERFDSVRQEASIAH